MKLIKEYNCGWIIMHTGVGDASNVVEYENVTLDVYNFFNDILNECEKFGINRNQLAFDMGIGFGKSYEDNLELIKNIKEINLNQ